MSKAALFKGLAAGASTLGHGLLQQQAYDRQAALDTAQARREASLAQLEREWAQQDAAAARNHDFDMVEHRAAVEQDAAMNMADYERQNPDPQAQADLERTRAQTDASRALTEKRRAEIAEIGKKHGSQAADLFGKIPFDAYTPASTQKFIDNFNETGEFQVDMLEAKQGAGMGEDYRLHAFKNSLTAADRLFEHKRIPGAPTVENMIENDPALATQLEITAETPITEARAKIANAFMEQTLGSVGQQQPAPAQPAPGGGLLDGVVTGAQNQMGRQQPQAQGQPPVVPPMGTMPGAGQQGEPAPLVERAVDAIQRGAPAEAVIQRMREQGASEAEIRQVQQAIANVR